jgi:hypothetical protein
MSEAEKQNETSCREVRPGQVVMAELTGFVRKYYLEGQHEIWIHPSGRVVEPFTRRSEILERTPADVLFRRGFVRADLEIYPGGPVLVELYGQVDRVGKWENHLPGDGSGKQLLLTNIKPAKEPVLWAGRSHDTPTRGQEMER